MIMKQLLTGARWALKTAAHRRPRFITSTLIGISVPEQKQADDWRAGCKGFGKKMARDSDWNAEKCVPKDVFRRVHLHAHVQQSLQMHVCVLVCVCVCVCACLFLMSLLKRDEMVRSPTYEMQHMPEYILGPSLYNGGGVAKTIRLDLSLRGEGSIKPILWRMKIDSFLMCRVSQTSCQITGHLK